MKYVFIRIDIAKYTLMSLHLSGAFHNEFTSPWAANKLARFFKSGICGHFMAIFLLLLELTIYNLFYAPSYNLTQNTFFLYLKGQFHSEEYFDKYHILVKF